MGTNKTLLCIHRDPAQLRLLQENGYELGLRLFKSRHVDAIVLEYHPGVADEIKQVSPKLPIVMWADHTQLPDCALKSVDALVSTSDPPHFVWAAVHFVLNVKRSRRYERIPGTQTRSHLRRSGRSREGPAVDPLDDKAATFSLRVWRGILKGTVQF